MDSIKVDYDYARAWDQDQGNFAEEIAEGLLSYAATNGINIKSVYDVVCGSSNLIGVFRDRGYTCSGTEYREGVYNYSKDKFPDVQYFLVDKICDLPGKETVDIITCTHDVVNCMETFSEWEQLFKNAAKKLSKTGIFHFDFYTKSKLSNWNETTYSSSENLDCVLTAQSGIYDKTRLTYTYYIKSSDHMIKTKDIIIEWYFELDQIIQALTKAGFKKIMFVDKFFNQIHETNGLDRIHIIAQKK